MLKKIIVVLFIVLFLVSCGGEEVSPSDDSEDLIEPDFGVAEPEVSESEAEVNIPEGLTPITSNIRDEVEVEDVPEDVQKIFDSLDKIKSFSYIGKDENEELTFDNDVYVRGDRIKITSDKAYGFTIDSVKYDNLYLDRATKKAYGTCQQNLCDPELNKKFKVISFEDFKIITPLERINELEYAEINEDTTKIVESATLIPLDTEDGLTYWVHNFYGLPYEISEGEETIYRYDNVVINKVQDLDVIVPEGYTELE